jgi:hypothetical protein
LKKGWGGGGGTYYPVLRMNETGIMTKK